MGWVVAVVAGVVLVASYLGHEGIVDPMPAKGQAVAKEGVVLGADAQAAKAAAPAPKTQLNPQAAWPFPTGSKP